MKNDGMRGDLGKRVMIVALAACLALLVFLFARRSVDSEMAFDEEYPRKNLGIGLVLEEDGLIRFTGEGKLYGDDVKALIKGAGIHSKDVRDIIVEPGITEVGYGAFSSMRSLRTLKLGEDVSRVAPGGLRKCGSLRYLYFPAGLQKIGLDFLYDCGGCCVVTPAAAEDLPAMENLNEYMRLLTQVDSYAALAASVEDGEIPAAVARWWK